MKKGTANTEAKNLLKTARKAANESKMTVDQTLESSRSFAENDFEQNTSNNDFEDKLSKLDMIAQKDFNSPPDDYLGLFGGDEDIPQQKTGIQTKTRNEGAKPKIKRGTELRKQSSAKSGKNDRFGLEYELEQGFSEENVSTKRNLLREIEAGKYKLRSVNSNNSSKKLQISRPHNRKVIDVTAAVQANPSAFQSHSAYLNLFKDDASNADLGGVTFSGISQILDTHFYYFPDFKHCEFLDLSFCPNITDFGIRLVIDAFPKIKKINVSGCRFVTETSLRFLSDIALEEITFDMTSVRYVPTGLRFKKLQVDGCPLIVQDEEKSSHSSSTSTMETLQSTYSFAKIVVIKPDNLKMQSLAVEWFKPNADTIGLSNYATTYCSGPYRIIECTEQAPVQLFLTNNCLILLPFNGSCSDLVAEYQSVERRFSFVSSILVNFQALAVPVFSNAAVLSETQLTTLRGEQVKSARQTAVLTPAEKEKRQPESNPRIARFCYFLANNLTFLPTTSTVADWAAVYRPHTNLPPSVLKLFEEFAKSNVLNDSNKPFFKVGKLSEIQLAKEVNFSSFAEILAETGNCWLESFVGYDGPSPGPNHQLSSMVNLVKLIEIFASAKDSTAASEDLCFLPVEVPICSIDHVRTFVGDLGDDEYNRLLLEFEYAGLGIFDTNCHTAIAFANLPEATDLLEHFVSTRAGQKSTKLSYALACKPEMVLSRLISALSKVFQPSLLWKSGAVFQETLSLAIRLTIEGSSLSATLICDDQRSIKDKSINVMQGSNSILHTICSHVLQPFSTASLITSEEQGLVMQTPGVVNHLIGKLNRETEAVRTFTREFDLSKPRCLRCLLPSETLAVVRRFHVAALPNVHKMVNKITSGSMDLVAQMPLSATEPVNSLEILTLKPIERASISLNHFLGGLAVRIKASEADKFDFQHVEGDGSGLSDKVIQSNNSVLLPNCPLRVDASLQHESDIVVIRVSAAGRLLLEAPIKVGDMVSSISHLNFFAERKIPNKSQSDRDIVCYTYSRYDESPPSNATDLRVSEVETGMMLEALSLSDGKMWPAVVEKVDTETNRVFICMLLQSQKQEEWQNLNSHSLFPIGFSQYVAQSEILFSRFKAMTKSMNCNVDYTLSSLKEKGPKPASVLSSYGDMLQLSQAQFNLYYKHITKKSEGESLHFKGLPYHLLEQSHLLGFPRDFFRNYEKKPCLESLSMKLWTGLKNAGLNDCEEQKCHLARLLRDGLIFLALPQPLTWQDVVWPSASMFGDTLRPNFLCGAKGMLHFANESPSETGMDRVLRDAAPLHSFLAISVMINQPHFIPDKFERIFPHLQQSCPFSYASVIFNQDFSEKREKIEHLFRNKVFPYLLDFHLFHVIQLGLLMTEKQGSAEYKRCAALYEKFLRADDRDGKHDNELAILPWSSTEFDYYNAIHDCPYAMCMDHMYSCMAYEKRKRLFNYNNRITVAENDKAIAMLETAGSYDSLITTFVCSEDNVNAPMSTSHPYITGLCMGSCELNSVPSEVLKMQHLTELILRENLFAGLPDELAILSPTLELLDISLNDFRELPAVVFKLTELRSLRADFLNLVNLDDKISNLQHLQMLSIRSNCMKMIPSALVKLTKLEVLDLSGLPLFPLSLQYIEEAGGFMQKYRFPPEASNIMASWLPNNLPTGGNLSAERNELLNEHMFTNLPRLQFEGSFPEEIFALTSIRELSLAYQLITCVPDEIEMLTKLKRFDLSGCLHLKTISPRISSAPLDMLVLNNCPLLSTPPAEIRKRGLAATIAFFRRLAQGSVNVQRTKLMFVGLGGAGKTSLVNAIVNKYVPAGNDTLAVTDGIDITDWEMAMEHGSKVSFHLWDFAGQVVYYNTHQFFLSNRAVYLIIWNIRLGHEHSGLEFWLSSIAVHAPQASVIVVGTHADQVPEERSFLPEVAYRERFSSICGFHYISSHTGQGVADLRQHILEVAMKQKHMGEAIPAAWLTFEQKLTEKRRNGNNKNNTESSILMLQEVVALADGSGIYETDELEQALQFLTDLGSIQYFKTDFLRDRIIVNPQWIVDVMASLVSVKDSPVENGKMLHKDLAQLWKDYPSSLHPWLLKLTEAFDLTFPLRSEPASIIPCMLPENAPSDFNWPNLDDHPDWHQTELVLQFKYLPTGLFNRAQVRLCQLSDAKMWRRGSLVHKNKHLAVILQPDTTSVRVKVQGPRPENISFLILEVFDTLISESFHGIQAEYLFSCPECVAVRASQPSMFEQSRIRRATELHIPVMQCFHYFHQIPTRELRQMLPAENAADFDFQLSRTVQQVSGIAQSMRHDIVVVGNVKDVADSNNFTSATEIANDLEKSLNSDGMKIVLIEDPDSTSFDQISLLVRYACLIICCLSPNFMASENCQAVLLCAQETWRKPLLVVLVRDIDITSNDSLSFFIGGQVYVKAINRTKYKPADIVEQAKRRLNEVEPTTSRINHPTVFISYCWQNSRDAIEKGTKPRDGSVGLTDPRELKKYLAEYGNIDCWLDIEQVGRNGLFEDIAYGMRHARVCVVCVSDEYVASANCLREFRFATSACALPVVLCVVGTGIHWKTSEVSLVVPTSTPVINFQVESQGNYEKLISAVKQYVASPDSTNKAKVKPSLGSVGRMKTMDDIKTEKAPSSSSNNQEAAFAIFQEMRELEQRRFLRQLAGYAESTGTKSYPRLVFVDVEGPSPQIPTMTTDDEQTQSEVDVFGTLQWNVRIFCEHEEEWHPTDVKFALNQENATQLLQKSAGYLGRLYSLLKHSANKMALPQLLAPKDPSFEPVCKKALREVKKFVKFEESFQAEYMNLLEFAKNLDQHASYGGLQHCQLAIGKDLWLCSQHQSCSQYRLKGAATNFNELASSAGDFGNETERNSGMLGASLVLEHKQQKVTSSQSNVKEEKQPPAPSQVTKKPPTSPNNTLNNDDNNARGRVVSSHVAEPKTSKTCLLQ